MDNGLSPSNARILVTGAGGFVGRRVVASLREQGFTNVVCLVRSAGVSAGTLWGVESQSTGANVQVIEGNLLSKEDCLRVSEGAQIVYHLAAGRGEKSFPDAFANSVITTRNLLDACLQHGCLKRFVNVSSFAVYTNKDKPNRLMLDESCAIEERPASRGNAYCFAKVKQEEMVREYGKAHGVPYVIVRPGVVYGPGNEQIHGRVGIGTFGLFLHLGGSNQVPLSYVDNCADAIVLAGVKSGIDGETFNVVDDDLPSSRHFLRLYKREVKRFRSVYVPHFASYLLCLCWEKYCAWSQGQLPNLFNRRAWHATWKRTAYANEKLKQRLGWQQRISTAEGLTRYFASCREKLRHA